MTAGWPELLRQGTSRLVDAGLPAPRVDAELLAAHAAGWSRSRLQVALRTGAVADEVTAAAFRSFVGRRAGGEPVQHITGLAPFRYLQLAVGPGVFVPRPETELLAGWAVEQAAEILAERGAVTVLDIGTGSGAIAASVATEVPGARVVAVEVDPAAARWAERNLDPQSVELLVGDGRDLPIEHPELLGRVDVLVTNPPYIPLDAWESVTAEVRDHDPALALWGGADGLDIVRGLLASARLLLVPRGVIGIEHAEAQATSLPALLAGDGAFAAVRDHPDLNGRPRYTTARRARAPIPGASRPTIREGTRQGRSATTGIVGEDGAS